MEKITIAKALKTIVLPDGKTVHEGDEFVYNFDFENAGEFEIIGEQNGKTAPEQPEVNEGKEASVTALTVEEMKNIRLKAKDLKISNWHTKAIERLLSEIAEAEKPADGITLEAKETAGNEVKNTVDGITLEPEQPEVGDKEAVSILETVEPDGQPDSTPAA